MNRENKIHTAIAALVIIAVLAVWLGYEHWAYGDWTCAFKRCIHASNIKP